MKIASKLLCGILCFVLLISVSVSSIVATEGETDTGELTDVLTDDENSNEINEENDLNQEEKNTNVSNGTENSSVDLNQDNNVVSPSDDTSEIRKSEEYRYQQWLASNNSESNRNSEPFWQGSQGNRYFYDATGQQMGTSNSKKIIDVSEWQGTIDWDAVKNSGEVDGVILRCGYAWDELDAQFIRNLNELNRLGIPYGIYLFSYANTPEEGIAEAKFIQNILTSYNVNLSYPIYYDLENWSYINGTESSPNTTALYESIVNQFMTYLNSIGYNAGVYSYRSYLTSLLNSPEILKYVSWTAADTSTLDYANNYYSSTTGWQYTSSGQISGIKGKTDISAFYENGNSVNENSKKISYQTHIQDIGWQSLKFDGDISGTSGQSRRLEGIKITLPNSEYSGSIEYQTHIQDIGWQDWKTNGTLSGTSGQSKRLEAIRIKLTGEMAEHYDVYYRVHAQNFGWLGWAKNGENAGTSTYAYRLEAIQVVLVEKNGTAPGDTATAYVTRNISYQTHIQDIGWQSSKYDGDTSGTSGQSKRLEGVKLTLPSGEYSGSIEYQTHIQDIGWQGWKTNGTLSGTIGQGKRLEAIRIKLTGEVAEHYDVYYRVHAQNFGWLGWAKNGENAGTSTYAYRLEAIQVVLVEKNGTAPGDTATAYVTRNISYQTHIQDIGWQNKKYDGEVSGTIGQGKRLEGIKITLPSSEYSGSIEYQTHIQDIGWQGWKTNGTLSGTIGQGKRLEAIRIKLTGEVAEHYDVYYHVYIKELGWLSWAKNGENAGTNSLGLQLEAIQITMVEKGASAPGNTDHPYFDGNSLNNASAQTSITNINNEKGTFDIVISNIVADLPISGVKVPIWCASNQSDIFWYTAEKQQDNSYIVHANIRNHKYHSGNYSVHTYINYTIGKEVGINANSLTLQVKDYFASSSLGNGSNQLYYVNDNESGKIDFVVSNSDFKYERKFTGTSNFNGTYSAIVLASSLPRVGTYDISILRDDTVIKTAQLVVNRLDFTPAYYSQLDGQWANNIYGGYRFGPTGCVPTSIAMALTTLKQISILPTMVADFLCNVAKLFNNGGAGAGGIAVATSANHWNVSFNKIDSYNDLVENLQYNKIICGAVGRGYFVSGNYTHEIVLHGFDNGRTYVRDPLDASKNGWYSIWDIWVQQSRDNGDIYNGSVFLAMYNL